MSPPANKGGGHCQPASSMALPLKSGPIKETEQSCMDLCVRRSWHACMQRQGLQASMSSRLRGDVAVMDRDGH